MHLLSMILLAKEKNTNNLRKLQTICLPLNSSLKITAHKKNYEIKQARKNMMMMRKKISWKTIISLLTWWYRKCSYICTIMKKKVTLQPNNNNNDDYNEMNKEKKDQETYIQNKTKNYPSN